MTGFGAAAVDAPAARIAVEVRSVNQRFLDVKVTAPREYAAWERELRDRVRGVAERGRIDVSIGRTVAPGRRRYRVTVRTELARAYAAAARDLARMLGVAPLANVGEVLRLPDLLEVVEQPPDVARELPAVRRALDRALRAFDSERRREGARLGRDMQQRAARLAALVERIRRRLPHAVATLRRLAGERMARLPAAETIDPGRAAQEAALLAERSDVTEELVRLASHLAALRTALRAPGPVGKRVEFLLQEIHRELNTTGAKTSDVEIGAHVVEAKGEVEKLREQVQNVE
jgi:uncharacterized protein (TIGR00255 family)